jgi:hypothetical protein
LLIESYFFLGLFHRLALNYCSFYVYVSFVCSLGWA